MIDIINMINISPVLSTLFQKMRLKHGHNASPSFQSHFFPKVLKTGEMLIMVIMLIALGTFREEIQVGGA